MFCYNMIQTKNNFRCDWLNSLFPKVMVPAPAVYVQKPLREYIADIKLYIYESYI